MGEELPRSMQVAALEGWASNDAVPIKDRLVAAQQVIKMLREDLHTLSNHADALQRTLERFMGKPPEDGLCPACAHVAHTHDECGHITSDGPFSTAYICVCDHVPVSGSRDPQ